MQVKERELIMADLPPPITPSEGKVIFDSLIYLASIPALVFALLIVPKRMLMLYVKIRSRLRESSIFSREKYIFITTLICTMYLPVFIVYFLLHDVISPQELLGYGLFTVFASGVLFLCLYYFFFAPKRSDVIVRTEHSNGDES